MLKSACFVIFIILSALAVYFYDFEPKSYEYAIYGKDHEEKLIVSLPAESISKYPGWKYNRKGPESAEVWYPSLVDKVAVNVWVSSKQDIKRATNKPSPDDRELSIGIGTGPIANPEEVVNSSVQNIYCKSHIERNKSTFNGIASGFDKYVNHSVGSPSLDIIYLPTSPIRGIHCITCFEKANCQILGITESGISYRAFYSEKRMPQEAIDVHGAVNKYLSARTKSVVKK